MDEKYKELIQWKKNKLRDLEDAFDHKNDSPEAKERFKILDEEYSIIKKCIRNGASSVEEVKSGKFSQMPDLNSGNKSTKKSKEDNNNPHSTLGDNVLFSPRIEALIQSAFQDGELTQKEKEIILRRAEKEGEDLDEFELLLNNRISKLGIKVIESIPPLPEMVTSESMSTQNLKEEKHGFSEKLDFLIKNAIEDGILTIQEKNAIIRRAKDENEDIDEVDIYIQSLLQKRQKELNEKAQQSELKEKEREAALKVLLDSAKANQEEEKQRATVLRECPKCGYKIPNLSNVCPGCGFIIETTDQDKEVMELLKAFQKSEEGITRCDTEKYEKDPILQKAYSIDNSMPHGGLILENTPLGITCEYWLKSNTDSIKMTLQTLYGEHPKVKKVLQNSDINKFQEIVDDVYFWINFAKEATNECDFSSRFNYAKSKLLQLNKFKELEGWTETYNQLKKEIDNLDHPSVGVGILGWLFDD